MGRGIKGGNGLEVQEFLATLTEEGDGRLEQDNSICQRESEYFGNIVFYSLNPPSPTVKYIFSYCGSMDDTFERIKIKMIIF